MTLGIGDRNVDGYNIFATVSHADQDPVKASARWHSRTADYRGFGLLDYRGPYSYPGNLYTTDNRTFLQPLAGCAVIGEATSANPGRCLIDESRVRDIVVESRRDALFVAGTATLPRGVELSGDATFGRTVFPGSQQGVSTLTYFNTGVLPDPFICLLVGHPQNPYPYEVALRTRFSDVPTSFIPTSDTQRIVVGLRQHDLAGWDVETGLLWSHSLTRVATTGVIDEKVLLDEVLDADGRAVPSFRFGDPAANDPALMARLYPRLEAVGKTSLASIDVRGRREVFALPGGAAQLALGAELRRETFSTAPDPLTALGNVTTLSGQTASGSRSVASSYGELSLPLHRTLEAVLAARFDHYSDFGGTTNTKAGVKWKVASGVAVRATYATAFRAPSFIETRQAPILGGVQVLDPRTCPVLDPANPNCNISVRSVQGGNPNLRPEHAKSTTAGIVLEPWRGASFTVDAFQNDRRDEAEIIDPNFLLANESQFPGYVVRNADGTLQQLNLQTSNLGAERIRGVDATARVKTTLEGIGRLWIEGTYEWLPHDWIKATPDAEQPTTPAPTPSQSRVRGSHSALTGVVEKHAEFQLHGQASARVLRAGPELPV